MTLFDGALSEVIRGLPAPPSFQDADERSSASQVIQAMSNGTLMIKERRWAT